MSDKKLFSAKEAALAVLAKTKEILEDSSLMKAEKLKKQGNTLGAAIGFPGAAQTAPTPAPSSTPMPKSEMKKYETENRKPAGNRYGKIEKDQKPTERDYNEYEVKKPGFKDSDGPRLARQVSPSQNPKEEAEGNNKPDGMEPEFEFKDKVSKELAKEKASHMVKSQSGMHTVMYKSAVIEKSEPKENDLMKGEDASKMSGKTGMVAGHKESGHEKGVHLKGNIGTSGGISEAGAKTRNAKYLTHPSGKSVSSGQSKEIHRTVLGEMKAMPKPNLPKSEDMGKGEDPLNSIAGDRIKRAAGYKESGDVLSHKIANEGAKDSHKKRLQGIKDAPKPNLKAENPDKEADAELGEKVEHDVENHMQENAAAERQEGHELMAKPGDKMEGQTESNVIPRLIGSAKLSKFMEHMHSKRKAAQGAQSQAPAAVGQDASGAPAQGSTQAGQSDNSRPKMQPIDGDVNKSESSFDKLKHKIENKEGYSEKGAAGAAYEAGVKKYGKAGMAAKAAAGRKK